MRNKILQERDEKKTSFFNLYTRLLWMVAKCKWLLARCYVVARVFRLSTPRYLLQCKSMGFMPALSIKLVVPHLSSTQVMHSSLTLRDMGLLTSVSKNVSLRKFV